MCKEGFDWTAVFCEKNTLCGNDHSEPFILLCERFGLVSRPSSLMPSLYRRFGGGQCGIRKVFDFYRKCLRNLLTNRPLLNVKCSNHRRLSRLWHFLKPDRVLGFFLLLNRQFHPLRFNCSQTNICMANIAPAPAMKPITNMTPTIVSPSLLACMLPIIHIYRHMSTPSLKLNPK